MKTKQEIQNILNVSNRTFCPKCKTTFFSVFDRLYIAEFGSCFECDEKGRTPDEKEVRIEIVTKMLETL